MPSLLDLPPEIILLIISHLQNPNKPPAPGLPVRKRPRTANGGQLLCPCCDDENIMGQILTHAGTESDGEVGDVMQLGKADLYLMDCIVQSRCCEMVDALLTSVGVIAPPPIRTTITSAVRAVNVVFMPSLGGNCSTAHDRALPLFSHLKRYPGMDRLILDCTTITGADARLLIEPDISQSAGVAFNEVDEDEHFGIRHLRIHLPYQSIETPERNSNILSHLSQPLNLPNLTKLHVAMQLSDEWCKGALSEMTAFKCLKLLASKWATLEVVKVCVRVGFGSRGNLSLKRKLWRNALEQVIQTFADKLACKIELCFVYSWAHGDTGVPLDLFEQTSDFRWTLKDNLTPIDEKSVLDAIEEIQATRTTPVPSFDLCVRYFDSRSQDGASRDLVAIRYRTPEHDGRPLGNLDCDFNRRYHRELHQSAWMRRHDETNSWGYGDVSPGRLPKLREDYTKAFPESRDDSDNTLFE